MTLENLLAIHKLQRFEPSPAGIQRLLAVAERNLADADLPGLSAENRFDAAYKTIILDPAVATANTDQPG